MFPASTYKAIERLGTSTPDEVFFHQTTGASPHDLQGLIGVTGGTADIRCERLVKNGTTVGENVVVQSGYEDALLLCFSVRYCPLLATKLGKLACVQITDSNRLKQALDA